MNRFNTFFMVERLKKYIEHCGLIASQFADAIGMPRSSFSQLMSGRNKSITDATITKIHVAFPDLSIQWLLFGEGSMIATQPPRQASSTTAHQQLSFFDENAEFETNSAPTVEYEQEIEPTKGKIEAEQYTNSRVEEPVAMIDLAKMRQKKVLKIMLFYDDNTFETFKPE